MIGVSSRISSVQLSGSPSNSLNKQQFWKRCASAWKTSRRLMRLLIAETRQMQNQDADLGFMQRSVSTPKTSMGKLPLFRVLLPEVRANTSHNKVRFSNRELRTPNSVYFVRGVDPSASNGPFLRIHTL